MHKIDYSIKQKGAELSTGKLVKASTCMGPAVHVTPTNRPQKLQERKYVRGHDWSRERLLVKELDLGLGLPSANESPQPACDMFLYDLVYRVIICSACSTCFVGITEIK